MSSFLRSVLVGLACGVALTGGALAQNATPSLKERINRAAIGVVSGGVDGTYVRIAADLASVLDDGDNIRVVPVLGKGSVQNIADILVLRGIDIGIVQSDVLAYARREKLYPGVDRMVQYITKLYNEELHILAGPGINSVADLAGKKVNVDVKGSGTYMTASLVLDQLKIEGERTNFDQALALEKVRKGEIAALAYVAGKPARLFRELKAEDGVKLLAIPLSPELLDTYLPSRFSNEDYPSLVPADKPVETVAVGAVMAVVAHTTNSDRYKNVARFVDAFFSKFPAFLEAPRHPKWKEVNLSADLPGWVRFPPAAAWLQRESTAAAAPDPATRKQFEAFLEEQARGRPIPAQQKEQLFDLFTKWQARQAGAAAPARPVR